MAMPNPTSQGLNQSQGSNKALPPQGENFEEDFFEKRTEKKRSLTGDCK
jgi:hypothetical protein